MMCTANEQILAVTSEPSLNIWSGSQWQVPNAANNISNIHTTNNCLLTESIRYAAASTITKFGLSML